MVKRTLSAVERYLDLPYHITLVQDGEENGGKWIAAAEELPDCSSRADSAEDAIAGLKGAMATWIDAALKEGRDIRSPGRRRPPADGCSCGCRGRCTLR
jgi:predicted RNase H-like HicB family nuclease